MRILIDTNVLISREDPKLLKADLQRLLRLLNENRHSVYLHPAAIDDINKDRDTIRKEIMLSKIKSYPILSPAPVPDEIFLVKIGKNGIKAAITNDNKMLYAIYRNAIDIFITEDKEILNNAVKLNIENNVMDISTALTYFENIHCKKPISHVIIHEEPAYNVNINDKIFDTLKEDYSEFDKWFAKISREGRMCWVYKENNETKAILIYKEENEPIDTTPPLPKHLRFKIATLKVDLAGYRIGELLLKLSVKYCINNKIDEIYLTHFVKEADALIRLIEDFGFRYYSNNTRGEAIYIKKLTPDISSTSVNPVEFSKIFYPSLRDGNKIKKFIVPIRPEFHNLLFQDYEKRQWQITEYVNINPQGNTVKKAYLTNSLIKKIVPGDVLLFYRSQDQQRITSIGVTENVYTDLSEVNKIWEIVGSNRSVYTREEIENFKKPLTVIIFRHHFNLKNQVNLEKIIKENILTFAPQSITEIDNDGYTKIKKIGGIDEHFTFN